jgi:hypothetical protein
MEQLVKRAAALAMAVSNLPTAAKTAASVAMRLLYAAISGAAKLLIHVITEPRLVGVVVSGSSLAI